MRTGILLSSGVLVIALGMAGLSANVALATEAERVNAPKMAVHNGDGARQNRQNHARSNRGSGDHNANRSRQGNQHRANRGNQNRNQNHAVNRSRQGNQHRANRGNQNRNQNHNARNSDGHNNQYASNNQHDTYRSPRHRRRDARNESRHARRDANHNFNNARHARHDARQARRHARRDNNRYYNRHYYGGNRYSSYSPGYGGFGFGSFGGFGGYGYGGSRYGNRYGYPFYNDYDLFPWWYGDGYGYRSRTSYRSGYGHRGHSNIYCTDPYHQSYGVNWSNGYQDQYAYSEYTDGTYGGSDVRDCHRETRRGIYGRRPAVVSSMLCYNAASDDYLDTGAQTLIRYIR